MSHYVTVIKVRGKTSTITDNRTDVSVLTLEMNINEKL